MYDLRKVARKTFWDFDRDGAASVRELKVCVVRGVLWKARNVIAEADLGVCLSVAVMAKGRRRMKAMAVVTLWLLELRMSRW